MQLCLNMLMGELYWYLKSSEHSHNFQNCMAILGPLEVLKKHIQLGQVFWTSDRFNIFQWWICTEIISGNDVNRKPSFSPAWIYGVEVRIEQKKFHCRKQPGSVSQRNQSDPCFCRTRWINPLTKASNLDEAESEQLKVLQMQLPTDQPGSGRGLATS